ncbi:hypothetical protein [Peptoniphilus sp. EMRHCC_23]|uniref:Ig-like domain-containing protein n=1 Tax=Peptoniphilus rachelemmaiella TaxID=2811779 RepID=UPI001C005213|nr:Ig-like domain-containing protein [Peptoniphilus rachelemmaiella]
MSKNKYLSLILSILMLLQIVAPVPAQALSMGQSGKVQKSEGQRISDRSEVFTFNNTEKPKMSWFSRGTQSTYGARNASLTKTENLKITTETTGLDEGEFNWKAFGDNQKFTAWVEVSYIGEKDENGRPKKYKVSKDIEISQAGTIETQVEVDAEKTVDKYYLRTEYQDSANAFKIKAFFPGAPQLSPKGGKELVFSLDIYQIVSTEIEYNLIDEYGKAIDLKDDKEEKPLLKDLKGIGKIGDDISFDLKNTGKEILWQEQNLDEWELMSSSLAMTLTKDKITSIDIDYKLTSTYDVINGGKVTIQRQKDVVTPKDPKNPGNTPDGYARINLSADALGGKTDGTFTKGDPKDTQRVVDVRAGKAYTTAQAEIEKQGKPYPLTAEKKEDTGKTFDKWTPELGTLGNAVAKDTKTLNATYKSSDKEIIPYLPGEEVPTKDKDGLPIPTNYLTVTFKSEDAKKGNVRIGDKEGETVLAKVKPDVDLSKKEEISTRPVKDYGFTKWEPQLGVPQEGSVYTAYFIKSGSKVGENDPIPEGWVRVSVSQDDASIKAGTVTKGYYTVKPGDKLAKEAFVDISEAANKGYKDPAWYVGTEKVATPENHVIYGPTDFIAKATQEAADKITKNGGLKAVDITAFKGDSTEGKFWNKGVALSTANEDLQKLLDAATVTDESGRTTKEAGEKLGILKVTFSDGSTIEVQNQKLIVKETEVKINFDKDANDDANAPRAKEEVVKGKISAADTSTVVAGATIVIKDKDDKVIGRGLANKDGSFVVGTRRPLVAGEKLNIIVTLPGVDKASAPVEKQVKLNPDDLNKVLPVGDKLYDNLKGKPGVSKAKLNKLKEAVDAGYALVPKAADADKQMAQKPAASVAVSDDGQKSLDNAAKAINDAIKALTDNTAPVVKGTAFKEIFKGEDLNLEAGIKVTDADSTQTESDIAQQGGKDFSYKVYTTNSENQKVEVKGDALKNLNQTPGTYEVVYMAKDKSGAEGTFTMTLVVKDIVYTKIAVTTDPTKTKYLVKDKDTKAKPDYTGTVITLTKNNGDTETATYDKATGKFKIGEKAIDELTIAPKEVAVAESPAVITATYEAGNTKLTANAGKNIIVQIDSDGNGVADTEENFDIAKAKSMEITNQPTLNYELDHKTGKASLDLKSIVVKVTDSLGNFKYFGYEEIKGDTKFALALGTDAFDKAAAKELTTADTGKKVKVTLTYKENKTLDAETSAIKVEDKRPSVIENPKPGETREGYVSVKFNADANSGLNGVNTFLVKKDTASSEVKVPTIVPAAGYKVKTDNGGWDKAIPATFAADFETTAQCELDDATSNTPKAGYTPITFDALDKGKIGDARTKTIYVNPALDVNLSENAPTVTANTGYSFKAWNPAIDTAKKYTKEERILATYTSDDLISDKEKAGYIKVTFANGKHGKFNETNPAQKTDYWVKPDTLVDLREKAPKVTANAGYIHTGWSQDLVVNFKADAGNQTITAQYGLDSDYSTTEKAGYTKITFDKGANGEFAKDAKTELWVNPAKELTLPAPGIVPHPGYSHTGWTKDNAAVNLSKKAKYTEATTITAAYESDISETEKTGFVKVSFDANKNGTIADDAQKDYWVNPNKEVNLTDKAPVVTPNSGYLFIKWDHKLVAKFEQPTTIKATYASAGDIKTEETEGFTKVTFDAGTNGKFAEGAQVTYWVNPNKELVLPEPRVIPNKSFEHTGWDPALTPAKQYKEETTITATYKQEISTEKIDGHQEIKFLAGDDGTFADGKKAISIWVKPDTLVDLRKSAPEVTVTAEGKTFTGWDKDLVGSFAKSDQATEIKAQYAGSTSETPVPGWTEITFKAGEHGNFGTLNKTPIVEKKLWVDPKADVKLSDKAPKTIDEKNWSFDKWMDGENAATGLDVAGKYKEAKTYTASYKSDISATPQEGFVKVTFAPGTDGSFAQDAVTETYVRKDKEVDLTKKAPKVTPKSGLSHKGWAIDNAPADLTKIKVSTDTTITAQYTKAISDKPVDGWTRLQFNSGENGRFVKDAVTVKWVDPKVKLTLGAIAPGITPDKNYRLSAWNDGSANVDLETEKLFEAPATFTAQYEKISSETEIEGFTKITFNSGEHGNFGTKENNPVKAKDIWVNPKSDVKLSEIAPELVIDTNWSFDKWMDGQAAADMNTAQKFNAEKTLTATYESDFSDEAKKGFVKVEFKAGDHGKFEQVGDPKKDQQTIVYVRKDKEVDMTAKAPKVTPEKGYYFTGWDKPLQKVYTQDTIHTGKNENAIATEAVDGWTQITFNAGDKGFFKPDAKTVIWVKPNTKITLDDQVPGLEIQKGYSCIGWKKDKETSVTDLSVAASYDKSTTFTAAYESDFSEGKKEGFIEVKFKAGDNGNFGKNGETPIKEKSLWVRPDKEVDLTDQAPKVTAHVGWKANGWDKEITKVTVKADTAEDARTFTAQYAKDSDTSKTEKPGYKKITFKAGDHGTFAKDAETVVYVNPDSETELSTIAPEVKPDINYSFKAWNNGTADVALTAKTKYTQETTYTAQYESDISETAKDGFVEVKFDAGTDGEFKQVNGADQKTTFYVKKDKLVDLTDKAPTVTGKDKKTFTGWDKPLKAAFTDATTINAKYTESISDKPVEGWTQLDFDQGDHGRFAKGQKNVKWVDPAVDLKLEDIAPKINPDPNWSLKAWNDGTNDVDAKLAQKFTKATTFTATYEDAFSPEAKEGFVKVTFDAGDHGKFVKEAVKEIYVKKDVELDLREKAPKVMPNTGYGHTGWTINGNANDLTKVKVTEATKITASYTEGTFDATKIKKIMVVGPTQMGYGVGEKLNLDGLKVIAIDDAGLQKTYDYDNGELVDKTNNNAKLGATIKVADKDVTFKEEQGKKVVTTELAMADNDKHIVVTKGEDPNKVTGETITALKIHENKSAKAENVKALNQNEVDGNNKPTDKAKATTTVTGKVKPGATVKITSADGQTDLTPTDNAKLTIDQNGNFTAEITKQNVGDKIQVIATEKGKQPAEPADATVARDANNDGKADKDANQKTATPTAKAFNQNIEEGGKVTDKPKATTTIIGTAEKGAKVVAKVGNTIVGTTTADAQTGEYTIEATKDGQPNGGVIDVDTEIKVTAQADKKLVSDPTATVVRRDADNNKEDDKGQDFDIKKAAKVEIVEEPTKMDYLVKDKNSKTKFETAGLVIKITDSAGKEIKYTASELKNMTDKITVEPADQAEIGVDKNNTKLKVTVKGSDLTEKPSVESTKPITVQVDADENGIADNDETTTITSVIARNIGTGTTSPKKAATFTTIEGMAEKGSTVTIKFQNNGQEVVKTVKADDQTGAYKLELKGATEAENILLPADTEVSASAKFGDKNPSGEITTKVFDDLDADGKADNPNANKTERPSALAYNFKDEAKTTIKGEAEPGAKVVAKVGTVEVGNATADKDGKYEISATQNNAKLPKGTKVSVTATLDPKGTSPAQETVVYDDLDGDGQPDTSQAFDKTKIRGLEVVASPNKMVYNNKEKLDLTGMKVLLTDQMGNKKLVEFSEFEAYDIKVSPLNNIELSDKNVADGGHNGLKIKAEVKVAIGNSEKTYSGETPTALEVNKDQTAKPTDVTAANQGSDTATKVRFKAADGAAIKIYKADDATKANLIVDAPVAGTGKDVGYFIATLNTKLPEGTLVEITAQESGKKESSPEQARVIRDKNSNWEGGKTINLSAPVISPIRENDKTVTVEAPKAEDKIQTIVVEDPSGNTVTLVKDTADKTWNVQGSNPAATVKEKDGKIEIPVDGKLPLKDRELIKVTFKDGEVPANEAFDRRAVQKASQKPIVDQVYTGDDNVKIADPTRADETATTIKVKVNNNDSMTIEKQDNGTWKIKEKPGTKVEVEDGKIVVPLDPKAVKGDKIEVRTINDSKVESDPTKIEVKDKVLTTKPVIKEATKDTNFVTGTAEKNADIVVKVTKKDGTSSEFRGKADENGNFKVTTDTLVDGNKVVVTASEPGKADNTSDEKTVGVDTSKLKESIDKADKIVAEDGTNFKPDTNPVDKALKDALDNGKKVKEAGDNGDPNTDQTVVDNAKKELDKAIAQKEADKAVDQAKVDPSDQNINDAQDKINNIPGTVDDNPIKKDLQDKLDLIKKIKEGEERLKQDDIKDKPPKDVQDLKDAIDKGKKAIDSKDSKTVTEATKAIEKAIDQINKERIKVGVESLGRGLETLEIRTSVPGATVVIKIGGKTIKTITTSSFGTYSQGLSEGLKADQDVTLEASKVGYNDGIYSETVD